MNWYASSPDATKPLSASAAKPIFLSLSAPAPPRRDVFERMTHFLFLATSCAKQSTAPGIAFVPSWSTPN